MMTRVVIIINVSRVQNRQKKMFFPDSIRLLLLLLKISIISVFFCFGFEPFFISTHSNHSVFFPGKFFFLAIKILSEKISPSEIQQQNNFLSFFNFLICQFCFFSFSFICLLQFVINYVSSCV